MGRSYLDSDLKILWGSHAMCTFPACREKLVVPATSEDAARVIGKICHIVAHSDDGPRGDPDFPAENREKPNNLVLMCGTHHDVVDVQPNTYTSADLRSWKEEHEAWVEATLADAVIALTFKELDEVAAGLLSTPLAISGDLTLPTPPARKMAHNDLTWASGHYYRVGQLRFADVEQFIADAGGWDPEFGERLTSGFQEQYNAFWDRGFRGDDLYLALADWASGGTLAGFKRVAAGIAILSYLFHICEVFEPEPEIDPSD